MTKACKLLVLSSLVWALITPVYLWYRDAKDQQYRKLRALAATELRAEKDEAPNDTVRIPKGSIRIIKDLAQAEARRSTVFTTVTWVSSGFILLICLCAFRSEKWNQVLHRRRQNEGE